MASKHTIMKSTVGMIGLGKMGLPMLKMAAAAGFPFVAFDRSAAALNTAESVNGVTVAQTIAEVARHDLLVLMLPDAEAVRAVLLGEDGALDHLPDGALVIDMSSSDPAMYGDVAPRMAERSISMIDAPVSGNVRGAAAGTLTIMAGGAAPDLERARPLLETMGKTIYHVGPLGAGQTVKALNNLLSAGGLILAIEVLLAAKAAGLDPHLVNSVFNVSTGRNNSTERKIEPFILNRAFSSGFALSLMAKDVRTAGMIAARCNAAMPLAEHVIEMSNAAARALGQGADHTEIARWIEHETGGSNA